MIKEPTVAEVLFPPEKSREEMEIEIDQLRRQCRMHQTENARLANLLRRMHNNDPETYMKHCYSEQRCGNCKWWTEGTGGAAGDMGQCSNESCYMYDRWMFSGYGYDCMSWKVLHEGRK